MHIRFLEPKSKFTYHNKEPTRPIILNFKIRTKAQSNVPQQDIKTILGNPPALLNNPVCSHTNAKRTKNTTAKLNNIQNSLNNIKIKLYQTQNHHFYKLFNIKTNQIKRW